MFSLLLDGNGGVICTVSRPNPPSYLLFYEWSIEIKARGANKKIYDSRIEDNDGVAIENGGVETYKRALKAGEGKVYFKTIRNGFSAFYFH